MTTGLQDSITTIVKETVTNPVEPESGVAFVSDERQENAGLYAENQTEQRPAVPKYRQTKVLFEEGDTAARLDSAFYLYPFPEPVEKVEIIEQPALPPAWLDGLLPVSRPMHSGNDPGFVTVIVLFMLSLCVSFRTIRRLWGTLIKRLWTTRERENYEHITISERRTIGLLLCVAIFFIALIWCAAMSAVSPADFSFSIETTLKLGALTAVYFLFQYAVYGIIGYTFTTDTGSRLWIEGFTSAMTLLGLCLLVPGLLVLFYPDVMTLALGLSVMLYIGARIMFICKGFRIFYTNSVSIVYFILYLCALEIIPVAILYYSAYLCVA